jgi:hypothetical protein
MAELALRFALGGLIVSLFAAVGELFRPKTFAGIFGAAPSVAIATLTLAYAMHPRAYAATECRAMILGSAALVVYSAACATVVRRPLPVWLSTAACWIAWLVVALGLWAVVHWGTAALAAP